MAPLEKYTTGTGQNIFVHAKADCRGEYCVIHNPSNHAMLAFPTHWRADRSLMERICPRGIGHPDPDDIAFKVLAAGRRGLQISKYEGVHGCDGCCHE